jgi:ABC-type branched-subunit amino acid transport system permease subunit
VALPAVRTRGTSLAVATLAMALMFNSPIFTNIAVTPRGSSTAVVANPVDRPETAPYDFRENAVPELPDLAAFRIFTREVAILQIHDGQ